MNNTLNKYFSSLLCIIVLALAPACTKKEPKPVSQEDVKKMIEIDDSIVFEVEEDSNEQKSFAKF